jgi:hypothetical protein
MQVRLLPFCIEAFSHLGYASLQEKPLHFERFAVWLDRIKGAIFSDLCYVFRVHMEHVIPEQDLLRFVKRRAKIWSKYPPCVRCGV